MNQEERNIAHTSLAMSLANFIEIIGLGGFGLSITEVDGALNLIIADFTTFGNGHPGGPVSAPCIPVWVLPLTFEDLAEAVKIVREDGHPHSRKS